MKLLSRSVPYSSHSVSYDYFPCVPGRCLGVIATGPGWSHYDMVISIGQKAPDCFQQPVILVNGLRLPALEVETGTKLIVSWGMCMAT